MISFRALALLALAVLMLSSCASDEESRFEKSEKFTTTIYANGLKRFELAYDKPVREPMPEDNRSMNGRMLESQHEKMQDQISDRVIRRLEMKLKATGYCRQGYVLSSEFSTLMLDNLVIKGECVEAASDADRVAFPNVKGISR